MRIASPWQATRRFLIRQFTKLLTKRLKNYTSRCPNDLDELKSHIKKGDVILVEGEQRVSEVIKYLTQSSWSHSALYIGDELLRRNHPQAGQARAAFGEEANYLLVEALVEGGVVVSPLSKYLNLNIRVCRPHNLRKDHLQRIFDEVISQLGHEYDLQNVFDLARYFLPVSIVPRRFRRKALHFGSELPTQVICSSMIAAAFDEVGFPVLPQITTQPVKVTTHRSWRERFFSFTNGSRSRFIFHRPHHSLVTPRDFDLSPYFEIVKFNVIESGRFDYSQIVWANNEETQDDEPRETATSTFDTFES
jgi:Permuted papain-like amidase enzyme, YaeF/YiiX, C92 family